jgi:hypothetical protein
VATEATNARGLLPAIVSRTWARPYVHQVMKTEVELDYVPMNIQVGTQSSAKPAAVLEVEQSICNIISGSPTDPGRVLHEAGRVHELRN